MQINEGNSLSSYADIGRLASSSTLDYLSDKKHEFRSSFLTERADRWLDVFDTSSRRLDMTLLSDEIRISKRRNDHEFETNRVSYLQDHVDIQHANSIIRRLVMSDPVIRKFRDDKQIEGWSSNYRDPDPGKTRWRHRDYRRLNKGIYKKESDGMCRAHHYYDNQGNDELALTEKLDALRTIDRIKHLIRSGGGEDPTSINGGYLT